MADNGQSAGGEKRILERGYSREAGRQSCGQLFPACSPRNSDGGDTDWASAEEKILRDVSRWLSPADLRRARLVCKSWLAALATLGTKATTPPEPSTVTKWKSQLEMMVLAMPCLQELTVGSKLSAVGAQQLGVLAAAHQLRVINIPYGQALQDRSLQALQPMALTLKELRIRGAASLSQRALLLLSVLGNLEILELKNCGKISWAELQEAWRMACLSYEAHCATVAEAANPQPFTSTVASSHSVATKLGGWLPGGGRLFRTSSPCSSSIQTALVKQKSGGGGLLARMARKSHTGPGAAAVAVAQMGGGAVGNGRSSSGGGSQEQGAVRKLLQRKQKQKMSTATGAGQEAAVTSSAAANAAEPLLTPTAAEQQQASEQAVGLSTNRSNSGNSSTKNAGQQQPSTGWSISSSSSGVVSPFTSSTSALYRVGSLVWQGTTAAAAALSSGSSIARQSSAVQTALLTYLSEAEVAADACISVRKSVNLNISSSSFNDADSSSSYVVDDGNGISCNSSRFSPSRPGPSASDKPLPAMPFPKLTSLSFTCSEVTLKNPAAELAAIASLTALTALEMGKCKVPDGVLWRLTNLVRLQKLKLNGLWSMGDAGVAELAKLTNLKCLALSEAMHVTACGLMALSHLSRLTALSVGLAQDLGPGVLGKLVCSLRGLQCLEVTASCWCDYDCELLAEAAAAPNLAAAAAAATAAASQQAPHMLWNIPTSASMSHSSSSKLMQHGVVLNTSSSRSNSSYNLRVPSASSMHSFESFSSYNLATGSSTAAAQASQQQLLLVLKLHSCSNIGHAGMAAIKRLSALQALTLDGCKNTKGAEVISQDLLPPKLTSLSMRSLPFGNAFSGCVNVPASSTSLGKLELVSLSSVHNGQLRRILNCFPKLHELSLAGSVDVGDAAMQHMPLLPKLQRLNLSGTRVTSQGLDQLLHLPMLKTLSLKGCNLVTDAGLRLLEVHPALQELDMSECTGVSERGLMAVMLGVPRLVRLDVGGCKAVTRELVQWCPHYLHLKHSL